MRRSRITITLDKKTLKKVDELIDKDTIRNRSHAIEHVLKQYTQPQTKRAVILAGGKGTHLRPYTYEVPKPLLPVRGKPILEHLIDNLKEHGITELVITISYLGDKIKKYFGNGERFGVNIIYSEEKEHLLTGGAVKKVQKHLEGETFLVIHGDILADFPYGDFLSFHEDENTPATVAVTTTAQPTQFGQFSLRGTTLQKFYPHTEHSSIKTHLIHCGIYAFDSEIFSHFPVEDTFTLEEVIKKMVEEHTVSGYVFEGNWYDVGTPENYEEAIKEYNKRSKDS